MGTTSFQHQVQISEYKILSELPSVFHSSGLLFSIPSNSARQHKGVLECGSWITWLYL